MYLLRGKEISLRQAVSLCDLDASDIAATAQGFSESIIEELKYMQELNNTKWMFQ